METPIRYQRVESITHRVDFPFPEEWEPPHFPTHVGEQDNWYDPPDWTHGESVFVEFNQWVFQVPIPLPAMVRILKAHQYTPVASYILVTKTDAIMALRRLVPAMVQRLAPHVHPGHVDYAGVVDAIGRTMRAELPRAMATEIAEAMIQNIVPQVNADNDLLRNHFWSELWEDNLYPAIETAQDYVNDALRNGQAARGEEVRSLGPIGAMFLRLAERGVDFDEDEADAETDSDLDGEAVLHEDDEDEDEPWQAVAGDDQHQEAQDQHQEPPQPHQDQQSGEKKKPKAKLINKKVTRRGS